MGNFVEVNVKGGLGNQIFGLAAGWAIASEIGCELVVNGTDLGWRGSNRSRKLELDLFDWSTFPKNLTFRQTRKILNLGSLGNRISTHLMQKLYDANKLVDKRDSPRDFSELLKSAKAGRVLDGGFIDFEWLNIAHEYNFPPRFSLKRKFTYPENLDTALHIRLGDFLNYPKIFPIQTSAYYRESLRLLKSEKFDIFTDDEASAKQRYPELFEDANHVFGPKSFSGPETFILLSSYSKIVTSSSTFSSTAAWSISMNGGKVACPQKMILSEVRDSRPTSWLRVSS